jgi:translation initiation factor IF-2
MDPAAPEVVVEKVVKPVLTTRTRTFSLHSRHRDRRRRDAGKAPEVTMKESTVKWMELPESITVGDLAKQLEIQVNEIIKLLMHKGIMASINQNLTFDLAAQIVKKFGFRVEQKKEEEVKPEEEIDDPKLLSPRPPVVTVLGHVDHGKTSLLDHIRKTNVAMQEDGGITQSIGAYTVEVKDRKIVFLDTPGHEAFTEMRARGAKVTDIAVLVVAADDGVMPQTVEAISHAKAAGVPVIVAINKIDKPEANPERVKQQMAEHDIVSEDWGGDVIMVPVSARSGLGIEELLEMILLVADIQEFKANPHRLAEGTIIESFMDTGHGPVATVVVQNGTLNVGDVVIVGNEWGRVKALLNDKGKRIKKAFPSTPAKIIGLSGVPEAGDHLQAIGDEKEAKDISESLKVATRDKKLQNLSRTSLDDLFRQMQTGEVKDLNIVLKADVQGSLEAVRHSLQRLSNVEININVLHGGVGAINKTDVMLAKASGAIIIGFNVRPDPLTKRLAEQEQVDIRVYRVIYHIIDDVKAAMLGLLKPEFEEVQLGRAEVRAVFKVSKVGLISGCYVTEGKITRGAKARVLRDGVIVFEGKIDSLRRFKDDVKEVETNFECGIGVDKFGGMQPGDVVEAYALQEVKRELSDVEQLS